MMVSSQNVGAYPCRLAPACSRHERCGCPVGQAQGAAPTPNYWDDTRRWQKGIFSKCRGVPLWSPSWAGTRRCPYPELL